MLPNANTSFDLIHHLEPFWGIMLLNETPPLEGRVEDTRLTFPTK